MNLQMKKFLYTLGLILLCATNANAAVSANKAVEKIANYITGTRSATIRYVAEAEGTEQPEQIICIMGDRFKINSRELAVWYDGKTQWTYVAANKEVNITEPQPEELAEINPLLILGTLLSHYSARYLNNSEEAPEIELTPKPGADGVLPISKLVIRYNPKDYAPTWLSVEFEAGNTLNVKINSISRGINYPHSTFVFNKQMLPNAQIIDLR